MSKKILWLVLSSLMVITLVMAAYGRRWPGRQDRKRARADKLGQEIRRLLVSRCGS